MEVYASGRLRVYVQVVIFFISDPVMREVSSSTDTLVLAEYCFLIVVVSRELERWILFPMVVVHALAWGWKSSRVSVAKRHQLIGYFIHVDWAFIGNVT